MLDHLDANPGRYDLRQRADDLVVGRDVEPGQQGRAAAPHAAGAILFDSFGSSEAVGLGGSVSAGGAAAQTAKFVLGPTCAVFTEDGRRVEPGSGEQGMVGVSGYIPLGYYKDEAKTAQTFRTFEGRRWSIPGDWAEVNADGSLHLLGRGSVCINTGGEKVFPEEVEEALKTHPAVRDAVAVGVARRALRRGDLRRRRTGRGCGARPRRSVRPRAQRRSPPTRRRGTWSLVDTIGRAPNGKVDYKRLKALAGDQVAAPT